MLPVERQQFILKWLEEKETLSITDLSSKLKVSDMTIYRDIKPLIEENKVMKTSGGIALVPKPVVSSHTCAYCFKTTESKLAVKIITTTQRVEHTCCAHCGLLRYADLQNEVSQILTTDFLIGTTISARHAYFLLDPNLQLHCCHPQVITFASLDNAEKFQLGFGGEIYPFTEAVEVIKNKMSSCCCSKK